MRFERVGLPEVPWSELDRHPDRTIFQTRAWLDFLVETQTAEPVVARLIEGREQIGWFTGGIIRHAGVKFLGSPMRGWTTSYMGFNLDDPTRRVAALEALPEFAFDGLGCIHLEVMDRSLTTEDVPADAFVSARLSGYEVTILGDDDQIMERMKKNGRRDVRRALRNGIEVERVDPVADPGFGAEYYDQVAESFAKRSLVPTYPVERVDAMIRHLHEAGRVVLLRSYDPEGRPVATGLFPGLPGGTAVFWMGASHRDAQAMLPNEALMWSALRTWRDEGAVRFDFGGGGSYKEKYGGSPIVVPWLRRSRFAGLERGRELARKAVRKAQVRAGKAST